MIATGFILFQDYGMSLEDVLRSMKWFVFKVNLDKSVNRDTSLNKQQSM